MKQVPNEFNLGLDNRRAIYIPFAQAVPKVATIDPRYCIMLKTGKCGLCSKVCAAGAIDYKQKDEIHRARSTAPSWWPPASTPSSWTSSTNLPTPRARTLSPPWSSSG